MNTFLIAGAIFTVGSFAYWLMAALVRDAQSLLVRYYEQRQEDE